MSLAYEDNEAVSPEDCVDVTTSFTTSKDLQKLLQPSVSNDSDKSTIEEHSLDNNEVPSSQDDVESNGESADFQTINTTLSKVDIPENNINIEVNGYHSSLNERRKTRGEEGSIMEQESVESTSINQLFENKESDLLCSQSENYDQTIDTEVKDLITEQNVTLLDKNDVKMLSTNNLLEDVNKIDSLRKSPLSKSVENIMLNAENGGPPCSSSTETIDTDKILTEFKNQKNKVANNQKLLENQKVLENQQLTIDSRYPRLPKELLNQDIGNIVKNVHGLFSSVSGSLKNAYNYNYSQKNHPKVITTKLVSGTKLMNEIFEDTDDTNPTTSAEETNSFLNSNDSINQVPASDDQNSEHLLNEGGCITEQEDVNLLRDKLRKQTEELSCKEITIKELEAKMDLLRRRTEQAERDKDAAVMRYATGECAIIEARKAAEAATKAERAAVAETELLQNKIKIAVREKQRICQMYDDKCHELCVSEREMGKVREELKELEGRLKWTQSKLRMEMDAYKDCSERAEKLSAQVSELETIKSEATANANGALRAKQLDSELKESQAALILCRHERDELDRRARETAIQLDTCKRERDDVRQALEVASAEVSRLSESNLRLEEEAAELAALRAQAALADTLATQVQMLTTRVLAAEELSAVQSARADTCARREAAALGHARTLTHHHLNRTQDNTDTSHKIQALTADNTSLRDRVTSLQTEVTSLQTALTDETDRRNKENRVLARKVAELTEELEDCNKKLEWEKGENEVLKKKHANAIKELNRELQRALKRCEQLEAKMTQSEPTHSRGGSISSLSSIEGNSVNSAPIHNDERLTNGHHDGAIPEVQVKEPDRQALIERIVSLQRAAARRSERCEFLEEHSKQLTKELRNKTRILRQFLLTAPAGSVGDSKRDEHKAEMARLGGGAMAALWGGAKDGLTLDLSLEINSRLQALLEDTLLKNITLKENMDTLGKEIERLKEKQNGAGNS